MRQVRFRSFRIRYSLRNEVILRARLAIIVRPAVNCWDLTGPVAVLRQARCRPFQCSRVPGVGRSQTSAEDTVDEVEQEDKLRCKRDDSSNTHKCVQVGEAAECLEVRP